MPGSVKRLNLTVPNGKSLYGPKYPVFVTLFRDNVDEEVCQRPLDISRSRVSQCTHLLIIVFSYSNVRGVCRSDKLVAIDLPLCVCPTSRECVAIGVELGHYVQQNLLAIVYILEDKLPILRRKSRFICIFVSFCIEIGAHVGMVCQGV